MSAPRLCLTDLRNPARWTKAQRSRECERAIVSIAWPRSPFGIRNVQALPSIQPGVFRVDGRPVGEPESFNAQWGAQVDSHPEWSLIEGKPIDLWRSGAQSTTAVDLTCLDALEIWTDLLVEHFHWAAGVHFDYFTGLGWLNNTISASYWRAWDMAYALASYKLRSIRGDWILLGQQFHLTAITPYVDGLYLEESPGHFGLSFDQIRANMDRHGHGSDWVIELREPTKFPEAYQRQVIELARERACCLSWGRDETAGLAVPA